MHAMSVRAESPEIQSRVGAAPRQSLTLMQWPVHTRAMAHARVLIVEDERFTRTILATTVEALGFDVVAVVATARGAMASAEESQVDVALLDLDLGPGPSGIDIAYALRERHPAVGLVFLTSFSDPRVKDPRERVLPPGSRFLVKLRLNEVDTLRDALIAARREPLKDSAAATSSDVGLTEHQLSVLQQLAAGSTNGEIAAALGVTEKAVERTVQRIADALAIDRSSGNQRVLLARAYSRMSGKAMPEVSR